MSKHRRKNKRGSPDKLKSRPGSLRNKSLSDPGRLCSEISQGATCSELKQQILKLSISFVALLCQLLSNSRKSVLIAASLIVGYLLVELAKFVSSGSDPAAQMALVSLPDLLKAMHLIESIEVAIEIPITEKVKEWLSTRRKHKLVNSIR
jgi:hypothetical protein